MSHKHADSMRLYAEDAANHDEPWTLWEYYSGSMWLQVSTHPQWNSNTEYRRKRKCINIGGVKVPGPYREVPRGGTEVHVLTITQSVLDVGGGKSIRHLIESGRCFVSADDALAASDALLKLLQN